MGSSRGAVLKCQQRMVVARAPEQIILPPSHRPLHYNYAGGLLLQNNYLGDSDGLNK